MKDILVREPVEDVQPFLAARHEADRVQELQVLGGVRLPQAGALHDLGHRHLTRPPRVHDAQAHGLAECPKALGDEDQELGREWMLVHLNLRAYASMVIR
ncbi:MAG TPA: hypothetical protein VF613_01505 [Longimicrobium sp.]